MNPSPLRYPGGKHKLYNFVREVVEANGCKTYIEPFCGGAAVAIDLLINDDVNKAIINDYDYTVYCFWDSIINNTDEFIFMVNNCDVTIDEWYRQKKIREDWFNNNRLEVGFSTFFLNRTNRSGIIDKAGPIGGYKQNGNYKIDCRFNKTRLIERIKRIGELRDRLLIYNYEAVDFIDKIILDTRKSFTFFDPPYYNKGSELYTSFYSDGDHRDLSAHIINKMKKRKWIITYDNAEPIKSMYSARGIKYKEYLWNYFLQSKRKAQEVLFYSGNTVLPNYEL